jgi:hypothetical protein
MSPQPPPPSEQSIGKDLQHLNMKNETNSEIFEKLQVAFIDMKHLAAVEF